MSRIKMLRQEKGLTQEELGKLLNVQKAAVSKYERGTIDPSKAILLKMSEIFNCTIDYILGKSNDRYSDKLASAVSHDSDLFEFAKELQERENMQLLFKQVKPMSDADIAKVIKIIKAIEDEEDKQTGGI